MAELCGAYYGGMMAALVMRATGNEISCCESREDAQRLLDDALSLADCALEQEGPALEALRLISAEVESAALWGSRESFLRGARYVRHGRVGHLIRLGLSAEDACAAVR